MEVKNSKKLEKREKKLSFIDTKKEEKRQPLLFDNVHLLHKL